MGNQEPFVQLTASLVQRCDGDANLAQIVAYVEFRNGWHEVDALRYARDTTLHLDDDGRGWVRATWAEVARATGQKPASVRRRLDTLVALGYLDRTQEFGHVDDRAYWYASTDDQPRDQRAWSVQPTARSTRMVGSKPPRDQRASLPLEEVSNEEENNTTTDTSLALVEPGASLALVDVDAFDEFWRAYPRKSGKDAARKAWAKAVKRAGAHTILCGAVRYRDDPNRSEQFTKHAATWLNAGCWDDDPLPSRRGENAPMSQIARVRAQMGGGR